MKRFIYLISPQRIRGPKFYKELNDVLKTKKVRYFQLRLKKISTTNLLKISRKVKKIAIKNNVKFIINDDPIIAKKINARRLLLLTDVEGVLDKDKKLILEINSKTANNMINDGSISGGMIVKINSCIDAVNNGVTGVVIVDGRKPRSILFEIFSDKGAGTLIRK